MNSTNATESLKRTVLFRNFVGPSFGHLVAAAFCFIAGFKLQKQVEFDKVWVYELISFCLLILPYYINRNILDQPEKYGSGLSQNPEFHIWLKKVGYQLPLLLLILVGINILLSPIEEEPSRGMATRLLLGVFPFFVLGAVITYKWPDKLCFTVRFRWFFPALLTCAVPFLTAWFVSSNSYMGLIGFDLLLIGFFLFAWVTAKRTRLLWFVGFSILVSLIILSLVFPGTPVGMWVFGILITMVMAISESWRLTTQTTKLSKDPNSGVTKTLAEEYRIGTNIAASIFPPVFLLTILHPNTNNSYAISICFFLAAQYLVWFAWRNFWKPDRWYWVGLISGYVFPILIFVGVSFEPTNKFSIGIDKSDAIIGVGFIIALLCGYFATQWKKSKGHTAFSDTFKQTKNCVAFTGLLSTFFSILGVLILRLGLGGATEAKLALLISVYIIFGVVLGAVHYITNSN